MILGSLSLSYICQQSRSLVERACKVSKDLCSSKDYRIFSFFKFYSLPGEKDSTKQKTRSQESTIRYEKSYFCWPGRYGLTTGTFSSTIHEKRAEWKWKSLCIRVWASRTGLKHTGWFCGACPQHSVSILWREMFSPRAVNLVLFTSSKINLKKKKAKFWADFHPLQPHWFQ